MAAIVCGGMRTSNVAVKMSLADRTRPALARPATSGIPLECTHPAHDLPAMGPARIPYSPRKRRRGGDQPASAAAVGSLHLRRLSFACEQPGPNLLSAGMAFVRKSRLASREPFLLPGMGNGASRLAGGYSDVVAAAPRRMRTLDCAFRRHRLSARVLLHIASAAPWRSVRRSLDAACVAGSAGTGAKIFGAVVRGSGGGAGAEFSRRFHGPDGGCLRIRDGGSTRTLDIPTRGCPAVGMDRARHPRLAAPDRSPTGAHRNLERPQPIEP